LIYADHAPSGRDLEHVEAAFGPGINSGINLSATESNSTNRDPL
jgi:hypothetical protein